MINNKNFPTMSFLVGWIEPNNATVVEMDWHDLLFQYGLIGFCILVMIYLRMLIKYRNHSEPVFYMLILSLIYTTFAGHTISGAFSGTMFSFVMAQYIINRKGTYEKQASIDSSSHLQRGEISKKMCKITFESNLQKY